VKNRVLASAEVQQGLDAIRDLDVIVAMATREDPIRFAAYKTARRIEGQGSSSAAAVEPPAAPPETPSATTEMVSVHASKEVLGRAS